MADEKALIKAAEEAIKDLKNAKMLLEDVGRNAEDDFKSKKPMPVIKKTVELFQRDIKIYQERVAAGEKAFKPIKGKKGATEKAAKELESLITATKTALKRAENQAGIYDKMIVDIDKSDIEVTKKLEVAVKMGDQLREELATDVITLPGRVELIENSFKKNVQPAEIKKIIARISPDINEIGARITSAQSVHASLKDLVKLKPSIFAAKAIVLVGEAEKLLPQLEKNAKQVRALQQKAISDITDYTNRLKTTA